MVALAVLATVLVPAPVPHPAATPVASFSGTVNGQARHTVDGAVVDAHDGEIRKFGGLYYLYGTSYGCGFRWNDPTSSFCGFNVYTSPDLVQWTGPTKLFDPSGVWQTACMHGAYPGWGCFRPRVIYNQATATYVLWINIPGAYRAFTATTPAGPFALASTPNLTGGDMGLYEDADGVAYVVYGSGARLFERRLSTTYLDVTGGDVELTGFPQVAPFYGSEAPTMFSRNRVYYAVASVPRCPYCSGTGTGYFMATSPMGPWYYQGLLSDWSCNGQVTAVSDLDGSLLFQSDQWLQTPNEYAANQFWGLLSFDGARIKTLRCDVGAYSNLAYFPWYDNADPAVHSANLHLVNPATNTQAAVGAVSAGGQMMSFSIAPGAEWIGSFRAGTRAGPVQLGSNVRLIASLRTQYGDSFNEVAAQPVAAAAGDVYFTWFDRISSPGFRSDNVHVVNTGAAAANVTVTIPGYPGCAATQTVDAGDEGVFTCSTGFGGPVHVHADQPVLASQRTLYYQTFNEVNGMAGGGTNLAFSWYDHASSSLFTGDNVHVISTSGPLDAAAVAVGIPGCPAPDVLRYSDTEWIYSCPFGQGFGGPVTVRASTPVLASQRVQYGSSFSEVPAQDAGRAGQTLYMPWYDFASSDAFTGDNVHVVAPAGGLDPSQVQITIPGCTPGTAQVSPSELIFSCARHSGFGGPVVVRSAVPVLVSQRVQYLQSFNETLAAAASP